VFSRANTVFMKGSLFDKIARTETSQGIAAITSKQECWELPGDAGNLVVLDRLQDPGNIGTIIRTAEAAGYEGIITVRGTADVYSPKVVRAAAGAMLRMPFIHTADAEETMRLLEEMGKTIVATALDADTYYYDADLENNIALVIGNEGNGISEDFIRGSHLKIKIPMKGKTESLNAAVAAGILMYQSIKKG
ncbi:MAG: RNA methyltransferase, partial [Eubacteriaceae bacterium]|nr:RNA methyltransferase [Eubacteriaceae bacterium]